MNHDEVTFEAFLAGRMKDKGISLKRLSEATGIAPSHLENMLRGNLEDLPSAPYFRGYLIRIGRVLDFDGEESWGKLRHDGLVKNAWSLDVLPRNRFMKRSPPMLIWAIIVIAIIIAAYLALELPRILGKPGLTIASPPQSPYSTASSTFVIVGTVTNADSLYLSNGNASSGEELTIAPDGSWQKTVLLQNGLNTFELNAKKFLGGETRVVEQIIYQSSAASSSFPVIHSSPIIPATGTFFE